MAMRPKEKGVLDDRQKIFVEEYLLDLNGARAARAAGSSDCRPWAARTLKIPHVAAAIRAAMDERSKATLVDQYAVVRELMCLGFSSIDHYRVNPDGTVSLTDDAPPDAMRAVASVKRKVGADGSDEVELRLWDKPAALKMLGQHLAMYTDKIKHGGDAQSPIRVVTVRLPSNGREAK